MIYVNVLLTVKQNNNIETVRDLLRQQATLSREEPGCNRFEVYQSRAEPRLFTLIERWNSAADLEQHRKAAAFREIYEPRVLPLVDRVPHPSDLIQ